MENSGFCVSVTVGTSGLKVRRQGKLAAEQSSCFLRGLPTGQRLPCGSLTTHFLCQ